MGKLYVYVIRIQSFFLFLFYFVNSFNTKHLSEKKIQKNNDKNCLFKDLNLHIQRTYDK
jgi:hypothetical protein